MYYKYDAPHPSTPPSDWSSEDWNGDKAKAREQCSLLDFNQLKQQLNLTLKDSSQRTLLQALHHNSPNKKLANKFQAMMLDGNNDKQDPPDSQTDKTEVTDDNKKEEEEGHVLPKAEYIARQEKIQQEEEERYSVYMSTFGYKGDDSDLDSEDNMESKGHAYPFLD